MDTQFGCQALVIEAQNFLGAADPVRHGASRAYCTRLVKCPMHEAIWHKSAMSTLGERLRSARERAGFEGPRDASAALGVSRSTYTQHENDTRGFPRDTAVKYARKFKVSLEWLLTGKGDPTGDRREALLIGKVGAGAEIIRFDDPDVLAGIPLPPGMDAPNAAEIEGDSQYPFLPGWLIFYGAENQGVSDSLIGKMCVVQIKDGPVLLKILKRGGKKGLWRLESSNAPPREDVRLTWAAMVKDIRPR